MKMNLARTLLLAALTAASLVLAVCSRSVEGQTYQGPGGGLQIEFQPGGKAYEAMGPLSTACSWSQSGATINLTCGGDQTVFTVDSDGALLGPPNGFLTRLTRKKL